MNGSSERGFAHVSPGLGGPGCEGSVAPSCRSSLWMCVGERGDNGSLTDRNCGPEGYMRSQYAELWQFGGDTCSLQPAGR